MIAFPNAKINLGLHIVEKRTDGFHNLETVFFPIQWKDVLEIVPACENTTSFHSYGLPINASSENNLCFQAWNLLHRNFQIPAVSLHLLKNIPMGAGLGGGSSDAAFTLRLLNQQFQLQLSDAELINLASQLGSDCAFFISNTASFATGRGEILTPVEISLKGYQILVVHPGIHIPTPWAFSQITPQATRFDLKNLSDYPVDQWKDLVFNQFEIPVFKAYPVIEGIKNKLYELGAVYASLSGSGSACFGIFPDAVTIDQSPFKDFATHVSFY